MAATPLLSGGAELSPKRSWYTLTDSHGSGRLSTLQRRSHGAVGRLPFRGAASWLRGRLKGGSPRFIRDEAAPFIRDEAAPVIRDEAAPVIRDEAAPFIRDEAAPRLSFDTQAERAAAAEQMESLREQMRAMQARRRASNRFSSVQFSSVQFSSVRTWPSILARALHCSSRLPASLLT